MRGLANTSVMELFFFVFLFVTVAFQTLGFAFGDMVYMGAVALFGILLAVKVLSGRYSSKDLVVCLVMLGLGVFLAWHTHKYTVLLSVLLLVAAHGIDADIILERFLAFKTIALLALFLLAAVGVLDMTTAQHYRTVTGEFETRVFINGASGNILHLGLCTVCALYCYTRYGHVTVKSVLLLMLANVSLYLSITRSVAGVTMTTMTLAMFFFCSRMPRLERLVTCLAPFVPVVLLTSSVVIGFSYGQSEFADFVNRLMTGRTAYDNYFLTTYGVPLFGANYSQLISEGNFDNSYVYSLVVYGLVFTVLLFACVTALLFRNASREDCSRNSLLLVVFLVYGLAESMYPSAVVNPSLFLLAELLFERHRASEIARDEEPSALREAYEPGFYLIGDYQSQANGRFRSYRSGTRSRLPCDKTNVLKTFKIMKRWDMKGYR